MSMREEGNISLMKRMNSVGEMTEPWPTSSFSNED